MSNIKTNLQILREAKNLSIYKLSELSGVAHPTIINIEQGKTLAENAQYTTLKKLADILGCSVDNVVGINNKYVDPNEEYNRMIYVANLILTQGIHIGSHGFEALYTLSDKIRPGVHIMAEIKYNPWVDDKDVVEGFAIITASHLPGNGIELARYECTHLRSNQGAYEFFLSYNEKPDEEESRPMGRKEFYESIEDIIEALGN